MYLNEAISTSYHGETTPFVIHWYIENAFREGKKQRQLFQTEPQPPVKDGYIGYVVKGRRDTTPLLKTGILECHKGEEKTINALVKHGYRILNVLKDYFILFLWHILQ